MILSTPNQCVGGGRIGVLFDSFTVLSSSWTFFRRVVAQFFEALRTSPKAVFGHVILFRISVSALRSRTSDHDHWYTCIYVYIDHQYIVNSVIVVCRLPSGSVDCRWRKVGRTVYCQDSCWVHYPLHLLLRDSNARGVLQDLFLEEILWIYSGHTQNLFEYLWGLQ